MAENSISFLFTFFIYTSIHLFIYNRQQLPSFFN